MSSPPVRSRGLFQRLVDGFLLGNIHPGVLAPYRRDLPQDVDFAGRRGEAALMHEVNRVARRAGYAMENVAYWVNVAGQIVGEASALGGAAMNVGRSATGIERAAPKTIVSALTAEIESASETVGRVATQSRYTTEPSVARTLMSVRDEALRITEKLEAQLAKEGTVLSATERGEFFDAVGKALARDGIDKGILPTTLRIGPAPSSITGEALPRFPIIDFWEPNGIGYDFMTATVQSLARHDKRYIGRVMFDGTVIRDVLPLVYPSKARPFGVTGKGILGSLGLGVGALVLGRSEGAAQAQTGLQMAQARQRAQETAEQERQRLSMQLQQDLSRMRDSQNQLERRLAMQRHADLQRQADDRVHQQLQHEQYRQDRINRENQNRLNRERMDDMRRRDEEKQRFARQAMAGPIGSPISYNPTTPMWRRPVPAVSHPFGAVSEGPGFTVQGSFGTPSYQRSILRGLR